VTDLTVGELGAETLEWDAFVRASPDGSPFHLVAWRRAVEQAFGHRPHYLMARRGDAIEGVLPLFEVRGPLGGRALISVPYGVYGGLCAGSPGARQALLEAATELGRRRGAGYVELRHRRDQGLALPTKSLYVTFTRSISSDVEANARAIPSKQRRMTRQGAKHGLRAELGREDADGFYEIYARSVHDLGSPVFPRRLFQALQEAFGKECQILTVRRGDQLVAGVLTLFYEDQVLPYYGGALRDALPYAPNDFMYWELMCHAARAGYRVFDFGRSREGTGAYHFKRHWGFTPTPLPYQYVLFGRRELPDVSPANARFRLAIEAWKRLPFPVTKAVGPFLTRYLP
jgi:FemAB-related protein (PEP-CTERM system-associated)